MREKIKTFLNENYDLICEKLRYAVHESFSISESGLPMDNQIISVVLTDTFELKVISHYNRSGQYTEDILYVLYSFESEIYFVEYNDVIHYLATEQSSKFENYLLAHLAHSEALLNLNNDALEEFKDLSDDEKLREIIYHLDENYLVLHYLQQFDQKLYEGFLENIYDSIDIDSQVDFAKERMYDNLYLFELN